MSYSPRVSVNPVASLHHRTLYPSTLSKQCHPPRLPKSVRFPPAGRSGTSLASTGLHFFFVNGDSSITTDDIQRKKCNRDKCSNRIPPTTPRRIPTSAKNGFFFPIPLAPPHGLCVPRRFEPRLPSSNASTRPWKNLFMGVWHMAQGFSLERESRLFFKTAAQFKTLAYFGRRLLFIPLSSCMLHS